MNDRSVLRATAFLGPSRLATGPLSDVATAAKAALDGGRVEPILVFDDTTGRRIDLDLSGTPEDVQRRIPAMLRELRPTPGTPQKSRGPGRPRLGVVSKEVTLLPRHWAWLRTQRGGASATLRRLVDEDRRRNEGRDQVRRAQDATYRFMTAVVGDATGFEEALRALYADDAERFAAESAHWPADVRTHALRLASEAFSDAPALSGHAQRDDA
jgi:hypothetical protein